ncbi:hypothetical protein OS493_037275 [Desmophyllum pertusum]|uniref:Uncharacterized protein n=1 Tax=Desmophyllum pertusum TaxID=174260 RepID=A0A9W9YA91_9CNID|nr:hypothetical protein OS493_037275 [Desmophyllum pertusum]
MATSCVPSMTIRAMIDSVGFEFEGEAKWYNNRFVPDEELWESSEEEEESDEEQIDESIADLEDECTKISIEKEKVTFEMLEEDRTRMNKDTVQACSYLGLKLDFLDRLEDMPPNIRNHRTLCDWVVIFLQNNYNSVSLTEKGSLNKELFYGIGFDPLSSAVEIILNACRQHGRAHRCVRVGRKIYQR